MNTLNKYIFLLITLLVYKSSCLYAQTSNEPFVIKAISKELVWFNDPKSFHETEDSTLIIACKKNETLFSVPFGKYSNSHNCPIALFKPTYEFVFTAKVSSPITEQWDAAQLIVWADTNYWAKLYLERTHYKKAIVGSIVTDYRSDDCNSMILENPEVYLRIAKLEDGIFFYYSTDEINWIFIRAFNFSNSNLMIGFSSESTFNENGNIATFSEIKYEERKLNDIFNGI